MIESDNVTESKKSDFYENKIQRLTNELEIQNEKRNQELEVLFEEIDTENTSLKKELLETKEELEEEKDKNNNIKNSIYNFNYYQMNLDDPLNEKNIIINKNNNEKNINNFNSSLFCDNIKIIKEENAKKILDLVDEKENKLKIFENGWDSLEKNIKNLIDNIKQNKKENNNKSYKAQYDEIVEELSTYNNKINSLINENYSNKKYSIILLEKLELAQEEICYLKERIIQEKKMILDKINEIEHMNNITHVNFAQEIINEINNKRKNYYNTQFFIPLDNLHQLLLESKANEKDLQSKNDKLKKDLADLKRKYEQINEQKIKLEKNASDYIIKKEKDNSNELVLYSQINKLKKEKDLLNNENKSLLKNNNELNEQILSINNKIQYELSMAKKNNDILLNQKNDVINNLNNKLNNVTERNAKNELNIEELSTEITNLKKNIDEYITTEGNYKNEIILLKKRIKENELNYKTSLNQTNTIESISKSYTQRITNLQSEKKSMENKLNAINNKCNSLMDEQNKMNKIITDYRNKNNELEVLNHELNNRLTLTDKNNEELNNEKEQFYNIHNIIRQIYQNHIASGENNNNMNIGEMNMLKGINDKLTEMENNSNNNQLINVNLIYNEDFAGLEQNKNSQLYENILLYLFHIKSQNQIEINRIINNYSELNNNQNNNSINQNNINQVLLTLKAELDEKYDKFEERIKFSINIDEIEQLLGQIKESYEKVIDNIMNFFYNNKVDLSVNNILTLQMPLDKYHQIINNTNSYLKTIETNVVNKISDYKGQGNKIENALNILIENVNNLD